MSSPAAAIAKPIAWSGKAAATLWLALSTLSCGPPVEHFLPAPISLSYENGLVSYLGDVRGEEDSRCGGGVDSLTLPPPDSSRLLIDVAAPLSVINTRSGRSGQLFRNGQVQISAFPRAATATLPAVSAAPRALLCDAPLVHSNLAYDDFALRRAPVMGGTAVTTGTLGAVIGADLLTRFLLQLRLDGGVAQGSGELLLLRSDVTPSCYLDAAVVPFLPLGGDLRVIIGDSVLTYPATRITVSACVEPLSDPLAAVLGETTPQACLSRSRIAEAETSLNAELSLAMAQQPPNDADITRLRSWLATVKLLGERQCPGPIDPATLGDVVASLRLRSDAYEPSGANMRFLLSTAVPDLILSESACLRLGDAKRCTCPDSDRVRLSLPGLHGRPAGSGAPASEDLGCPLRLGGGKLASLALMAGGLHLSPCGELARSRRQRHALPKLDATETLGNDCEREACLQNLVRQSELSLRRCGYTGMDIERACDDHQAQTAAYVEIGGGARGPAEPEDTVAALVVSDSSPILQSTNADLRNSSAQVDGVLGVSLLRRLQTVIDYPQRRLAFTCRCAALGDSGGPQRCQTYRGVSYNAADGCSPNSNYTMPRNFARTACN